MTPPTLCEGCDKPEGPARPLFLFEVERVQGEAAGEFWEEVLCATCANRASRCGDVKVTLLDGGGLPVQGARG
jgi:hypothetical protein